MSMTTARIWTCDRCGRTRHMQALDAPEGWRRVEIVQHDENNSLESSYDTCSACTSLVERLLEPTDAPGAQKEDQVAQANDVR